MKPRRKKKKLVLALAAVLALVAVLLFLPRGGPSPGPAADPSAGTGSPDHHPTSTKSKSPQHQSQSETWAHNGSGLEPDPRARWGELPNGLRYVIYPHPFPADRASLRLLVEAGSFMEADDQQGVAHFVEHMAFNGTRKFAADDTMERFQRLGMRTGADTNASTSFDHTVYKLDLPNTEPELLGEGFLFLRDVADGILFEPEQIELERAVVLSEMRERRGKSITYERHYRALFPESLISKRFPIGTEEVIRKVPRQRLVDFYQKYYTANRMVLVVTGDVEIARVERKIYAEFTTLAESPRAEDPELGQVTLDRGVVAFATGPKGEPKLWMRAIQPIDPEPDSPERRRLPLVREIANTVVNTRTYRSRTLPDMDCSWQEHSNFATTENLSAVIGLKEWRHELVEIASEWKRFRDLGFTRDEVEVSKTRLLRRDLKVLKSSLTQSSKTIADDIVQSINQKRVHTAPEDEFARRRGYSAMIKKAECEIAFGKAWDSKDVCLILPEEIDLAEGEQIEAQLLKGWDQAIWPKPERDRPKLQFEPLGAAGEVALTRTDEKLGVTCVDFSNGVRLNFKRLDTVAGVFDARASFAGGRLSIPEGKSGIYRAAEHLFNAGGTRLLSPYDLVHATTGRLVDCDFQAGGFDAFRLYGTATSDQLNTQLRLMCACLKENDWKRGTRLWDREKDRRIYDAWRGLDREWWRLTGSTLDFGSVNPLRKNRQMRDLATGFNTGLMTNAELHAFSKPLVIRLEKIRDGEMVAYVRALSTAFNVATKTRWWLLKNSAGQWQAYDFEGLALTVNSAVLLEDGDTEAALAGLKRAQEVIGDAPILYYHRANCLSVQGEYQQAIQEFARYTDILGWDSDVHEMVSDCYYKLDDLPKALEHAEKGIADNPQSPSCLASLAACLPEARRGEIAEHIAAQTDPEFAYETILDYVLGLENDEVYDHVLALFKAEFPINELIEYYEDERATDGALPAPPESTIGEGKTLTLEGADE